MNSQKGFALIGLISLLPVFLAGGLAFFSAFAFLKSDLATLNVCRAKQIQIQNLAGKNLGKLLKLNPRALKLRLSQVRAERALAAAIESGQPLAIAAAEAYLLKIQMQRQTLDFKQKALIETANTRLHKGASELQQELRREWSQHNSPLKSWIQSSLHMASGKVPKLAVQADLPEVAPLYKPLPAFEESQAWAQSWNLEFKTVSWTRKFLNFNERFQRSCSTSLHLETETDQWAAHFKRGRF